MFLLAVKLRIIRNLQLHFIMLQFEQLNMLFKFYEGSLFLIMTQFENYATT